MKRYFFLAFLLCFFTACDAQNHENKSLKATPADTTQPKPEVSWKVNKRFDNEGNLVGYDSSFSWSYSGNGDLSGNTGYDSLVRALTKEYDYNFTTFFNDRVSEKFVIDSTLNHDLFSPGLFSAKWMDHFFDTRKVMQQMDSMSKLLLNEDY